MKTIYLLLLSFMTVGQAYAASKTLKLKKNGQLVKTITLSQDAQGNITSDYNELGMMERDLYNVWRKAEKSYKGYDFMSLMVWTYGAREFHDAKKIVFKTKDGYQPVMTIKEYQNALLSNFKWGLVAFTEVGKQGFTDFDKNGLEVNPGPFYLVWTGYEKGDVASHGDVYKSPYQLTEINLVY